MKHIDLRTKRGCAKDLALSPITERDYLYKTLTDTKDRIIFLLGCYAGMRSEEIGQCRFTWLEWEEYGESKILTINIPLEDKNTRLPYKKFKQKKDWKTGIYVFDNEIANEIWFWFMNNKDGLKISRQSITTRRVKPHFGKLLNRTITTHALRSTFINYVTQELRLPNGEKPDPMFVKTLLRHRDLRTTMKHYKTENKAQQQSYLKGVMK
jgi:integrase